jgi:hypothetical protein
LTNQFFIRYSLAICIRGISNLLISNENVKKFSLRNPSHPFVIILRNINENFDFINQFLFEEIRYIHQNK